MINNSEYCPLYHKGLYIEKINSSEAHLGMCCFQTLSKNAYQKIDFLRNEYLSDLRSQIKSDNKITACEGCWANEEIGNQSYRQGQILAFESNNIEINTNTELVSLLYNCENTCNLRCITCGPKFSSAWRVEYEKLGYEIQDNTAKKTFSLHNVVWQSLDFSKLRLLHFTGGEPLLTVDHENVLEKVKEQGNINQLVVSYNTNGTIFPSARALDLWRDVKLLKLYFSIDSIGESFEYIRYPASWKQVEENLFKIRELDFDNCWFQLGVTIGINNIFYLQDLIDWRDQYFAKTTKGDPIDIYINFVNPIGHGGEVLQLNQLNDEVKQKIIKYLKTLSDQQISQTVINYLLEPSIPSEDWIDYLNKLDLSRSTNWQYSLSKLYNSIK
jgi:MoaA/NifB/PqqE/SkfB family radical SAM enzyme